MVFARDALTRAMREIAGDPEHIVGLTSFFENVEDPSRALVGGVEYDIPDTQAAVRLPDVRLPAGVLQQPHAMVAAEVHALRRGRVPALAARPPRGARRLVARLHVRGHRAHVPRPPRCCASAVATTGSPASPTRVGVTEGPDYRRKLVSQRERWQRVILETWWANRRMCFNTRYGTVGTARHARTTSSPRSWPRCSRSWRSGPSRPRRAVAGHIEWWQFALVLLAIAFVNSALNAGALLMLDLEARAYRACGHRPAAWR